MAETKITLSPEQALDTLDRIASEHKCNRGTHQILEGSVKLLRTVLEDWRSLKALLEKEEGGE